MSTETASNPTTTRYQVGGPWDYNNPVHENIVLAAIYQQRTALNVANANFSDIWSDFSLNEYLRGVYWNDDPEVLMFDDDNSTDANFSSGILWSTHFSNGGSATSNDKNNLTGRVHYWDMQFVHGMACVNGEPAATTRQRALMWAEFMYKVAVGETVNGTDSMSTPANVAATKLSDVKIPAGGNSDPTLTIAGYFDSSTTNPRNNQTIKYLLARTDPYPQLDIGKRAIGSVMHLIQDSYAHGHTSRTLLNPGDLKHQTVTAIQFNSGTYGRWGNVITFHAYKGQDSDAHEKFDDYTNMDPTDLTTFNGLVGGRDAIDKCAQLLSYFAARTPYANGPKALMEGIFTLDPKATPANTLVNRSPIPGLINTGKVSIGTVDPNFSMVPSGSAYAVNRDGNWVQSDPAAKWIAPTKDASGNSNTDYTYRITFNLQGFDVNTVAITGRCAADDACTAIKLNGTALSYPWGYTQTSDGRSGIMTVPNGGPSYQKYVKFYINSPGVTFVSGSNHLDFVVHNNGGPTGLNVVFDFAGAVQTVPPGPGQA